MEKHAYLIVANSNLNVLEYCLKMIDDIRNDVFILFDAKSHISENQKELLKNCVNFSRIQFEKEVKVNWAGYSQIQAVLNLLKAATSCDDYEYIHFMQGSDLPIKSQNEIHKYFSENVGYQFIQVEKDRTKMAEHKAWYRHYFCHNRYFRKNKFMKILNFGFVYAQRFLGIKKNTDIDLYQGSALFSITSDCARFILSQEAQIRKRFRFSLAADEVFLHTILMNSDFKNKIKNISKEVSSNARLIDRTRPDGKNSPHVWRKEELEYILNQSEEFCFARKFDEKIDFEIVKSLYHEITAS